jgi:hypothetical protein
LLAAEAPLDIRPRGYRRPPVAANEPVPPTSRCRGSDRWVALRPGTSRIPGASGDQLTEVRPG